MLVNGEDGGAIVLYTFSDTEQDSAAPVARLLFPPILTPNELYRIVVRTPPLVASPTPGRPFGAEPEARMHLIELNYSSGTTLHMLLPNRYLASLLPHNANNASVVTRLDWPQWGPGNTRIVPEVFELSRTMRYVDI